MRKVQQGFTLVELIVVITILAILGTIAFISLQGYTQDARNSKVSSDLSNLSTAVNVSLTGGTPLTDMVNANEPNHNVATAAVSYGSGFDGNGTGETYETSTVNFGAIRQNGDDFKDPTGENYLMGIATHPAQSANDETFAFYQLVGQIKDAAWSYTAVVKWNYVKIGSTDMDGLVKPAQAAAWYATWVTNEAVLGVTGLY